MVFGQPYGIIVFRVLVFTIFTCPVKGEVHKIFFMDKGDAAMPSLNVLYADGARIYSHNRSIQATYRNDIRCELVIKAVKYGWKLALDVLDLDLPDQTDTGICNDYLHLKDGPDVIHSPPFGLSGVPGLCGSGKPDGGLITSTSSAITIYFKTNRRKPNGRGFSIQVTAFKEPVSKEVAAKNSGNRKSGSQGVTAEDRCTVSEEADANSDNDIAGPAVDLLGRAVTSPPAGTRTSRPRPVLAPESVFICQDDSWCISGDLTCDNVTHCPDRSDENGKRCRQKRDELAFGFLGMGVAASVAISIGAVILLIFILIVVLCALCKRAKRGNKENQTNSRRYGNQQGRLRPQGSMRHAQAQSQHAQVQYYCQQQPVAQFYQYAGAMSPPHHQAPGTSSSSQSCHHHHRDFHQQPQVMMPPPHAAAAHQQQVQQRHPHQHLYQPQHGHHQQYHHATPAGLRLSHVSASTQHGAPTSAGSERSGGSGAHHGGASRADSTGMQPQAAPQPGAAMAVCSSYQQPPPPTYQDVQQLVHHASAPHQHLAGLPPGMSPPPGSVYMSMCATDYQQEAMPMGLTTTSNSAMPGDYVGTNYHIISLGEEYRQTAALANNPLFARSLIPSDGAQNWAQREAVDAYSLTQAHPEAAYGPQQQGGTHFSATPGQVSSAGRDQNAHKSAKRQLSPASDRHRQEAVRNWLKSAQSGAGGDMQAPGGSAAGVEKRYERSPLENDTTGMGTQLPGTPVAVRGTLDFSKHAGSKRKGKSETRFKIPPAETARHDSVASTPNHHAAQDNSSAKNAALLNGPSTGGHRQPQTAMEPHASGLSQDPSHYHVQANGMSGETTQDRIESQYAEDTDCVGTPRTREANGVQLASTASPERAPLMQQRGDGRTGEDKGVETRPLCTNGVPVEELQV